MITSKELLKDRYFLASILKAVVQEYKDVSEQDIASKYIEPESIRDDAEVSENEYGLVFKANRIDASDQKIQIKFKIDIEVHDNDAGLMSRRSVCDGAKMLDEQMDKVCTIWICMNPPEHASNTITRFKFGAVDANDCDLLESVIIGLGNEEDSPNNKMYDLLYALFGNKSSSEKISRLRELGYEGTSLEKIMSK